MASITNSNGLKTIQFKYSTGGKRYSIRLGKLDMKQAQKIAVKVEELLACKETALPWSMELSSWINAIGEDLTESLVKVGLLPTLKNNAKLGVFTREYIEGQKNSKATTRRALLTVALRIIDYFGSDSKMKDVTSADADNFKIFLLGKYSQATAGRTIRAASQFFRAAMRAGLTNRNVFTDVKAPSEKNKNRQFFIDRPMLDKLLEACPDHQWKMIIALTRIGGLRNPSEVLLLKWTDIDWHKNKFLVHSPKTEHHEGKDQRFVPLFPVLREILEEGFHLAKDGEVFVIGRYRDACQNLRTTFQKIIQRAGLLPWPKLFTNLRSSRSTELARNGCPMHLITAWIGNSEKIQNDHYLQVNDTDFDNAYTYEPSKEKSGAKSGAWSEQKAVQQQNASSCNERQELGETLENKDFPSVSSLLKTIPISKSMGATGFEPKAISTISTNDLEKHNESVGAESGALVGLIRQIVNLSETELAKISKALINSKGNS